MNKNSSKIQSNSLLAWVGIKSLALVGFGLLSSGLAVMAQQIATSASSSSGTSNIATQAPSAFLSRTKFSISQTVAGDTVTRKAQDEKALENGLENPLYDRDAVYFDSFTVLGAKYKLDSGSSVGIQQRFVYSQSVRSDRQGRVGISPLWINYQIPFSGLGGAEGMFHTRVGVAHTHELYHDNNYLGFISLMPSASWTLTSKLSVNYSGNFAAYLYNGPQRETLGWQNMLSNDSYVDTLNSTRSEIRQAKVNSNQEAKMSEEEESQVQALAVQAGEQKHQSFFTKGAQERNFYLISNGVSLGWKINDRMTFSPGLAYSIISRNFKNTRFNSPGFPNATSMVGELNAELEVSVIKNLSMTAGIAQSHPFLEGSADPVTGVAFYYRDGFALLYPRQVSGSLAANYTF